MRTRPKPMQAELPPLKQSAYDPNDLHPLDQFCRQFDSDDGIDYDEILATTEDDFLAGNFAFNSDDYPTEEEVQIAHKEFLASIHKEVMDELAAERALDATRTKRR